MKNINWRLASNHLILLIGVLFMSLPVWVAFATSTHTAETILREGLQFWPGSNFIETYREVMFEEAGVMKSVLGITMLKNSLILGIGFAVGKVIISMLAAYAIVYFRFRLATPLFWIIFPARIIFPVRPLHRRQGLLIPLRAILVMPCWAQRQKKMNRPLLPQSRIYKTQMRGRPLCPEPVPAVICQLPLWSGALSPR